MVAIYNSAFQIATNFLVVARSERVCESHGSDGTDDGQTMYDEASAYVEIQQLQRHYADLATRGAFHEVTKLATPGALFTFDTHSGEVFEIRGAAEFAAFSQRMAGGFRFFEYIPLNFTVTFESGASLAGGPTRSRCPRTRAVSGVSSMAPTATSTRGTRASGGSRSESTRRTAGGPRVVSRRSPCSSETGEAHATCGGTSTLSQPIVVCDARRGSP